MTQMNVSTKRKKNHILGEQTCGCQGERKMEEGCIRNLGLADMKYHVIIYA